MTCMPNLLLKSSMGQFIDSWKQAFQFGFSLYMVTENKRENTLFKAYAYSKKMYLSLIPYQLSLGLYTFHLETGIK